MPHQIRHPSCSETALINRLLPVEILIMIFFLVGPASFKKPYVYLRLSWVCRHWRYIVLDTPRFWTIIKHQCKHSGSHELTRNFVFRSRSHKVDVAWCRRYCDKHSYIATCVLSSKRSQIRTLFINSLRQNEPFTQLENLIFSNIPAVDLNEESFNEFLFAANPRLLELPVRLLYKGMTRSLRRTEWLKLWYFNDVNTSIVAYVLENLPSLRILNLIAWGGRYYLSAFPAITLPNLRMFSVDSWSVNFSSIQTPALSYFGATTCRASIYCWGHLDNIDLSMIKSLRIAICHFQIESPRQFAIACISTGHSEEDCQFFNNFHAPVVESQIDHLWTLPPANSFHVPFKWALNNVQLFSRFKRATNLVELVLDCRSIKSRDWASLENQEEYQIFLEKALKNFDTIIHLTVLRCCSFVPICNILMDGQRLPRLERLTYHSSYNLDCVSMTFVSTRMAMVQIERLRASSNPLKILELKNFLSLPRREVEEIEGLGIQVIQTSSIKGVDLNLGVTSTPAQ